MVLGKSILISAMAQALGEEVVYDTDPLAGLEALETGTPNPRLPGDVLKARSDVPVGSETRVVVQPVLADEAIRRGDAGAPEAASLRQAIEHWCAAYQVSCADMHSIAECESTYGQDPNAYNGRSGFWGAFQFHPSTWLSTPPGQRGELATDDWAAAEGAAWMIFVGRRGEWPSC